MKQRRPFLPHTFILLIFVYMTALLVTGIRQRSNRLLLGRCCVRVHAYALMPHSHLALTVAQSKAFEGLTKGVSCRSSAESVRERTQDVLTCFVVCTEMSSMVHKLVSFNTHDRTDVRIRNKCL